LPLSAIKDVGSMSKYVLIGIFVPQNVFVREEILEEEICGKNLEEVNLEK
jgi:hypothetical protein